MHVKDRLPELKQILGSETENESVQIEVQADSNEKMQAILKEIEKIRAWIDDINERTKTMKRLYSEPLFQVSEQMQEEMQSSMIISTAVGLKVCGALKEFHEKINSQEEGNVVFRVIHLQYVTTNQLYLEALEAHQSFLNKYRESRLTLLRQQIKLTNTSISEEECQGLLDSNNLSIFVDNIEADTKEAQIALQDVESRHRELIRIENALKEVRDMFLQMASLVNQQQDLINTVEYFANRATNYVDCGNQELVKGAEHKRKAKKKTIIICVLIGALLLIVIAILFG